MSRLRGAQAGQRHSFYSKDSQQGSSSTFQLLPVWEDTDGCCRRLKMFPFVLFFSPPIKPKKKKRKHRNSISAPGRPCSVWVVFKKRSVFSEWPSERRGSNDMRVTAVLLIRPHNRPLSTSLCAAEAHSLGSFYYLPGEKAAQGRQ